MWKVLGTYLICFLTLLNVPSYSAENDEARLRKHLFPTINVDKHTRPLLSHNETVMVDVLFDITHIRSLDESSGTITVNGLMKLSWIDKTYRWDSSNFGEITHLALAYGLLWTPDISAYNSANSKADDDLEQSSLILDEEGQVHWLFRVTFWTTCKMDHRLFPFDDQHCDIILGSWSHDTSSVQLQLAEEHNQTQVVLLEFYAENPQWDLFGLSANSKHFPTAECCSEPYNVIEYKLSLRRRPSHQKILFVMPSLVAALLTLSLYWLPPNASEKITLGGIILIIQVMLLLFMGWYIPQGGDSIPVIILYCGNSLILTGLTLIVSIIVINISRFISYRSPIPAFLRSLIMGPLGKVLCIGPHYFQHRRPKLLDENNVEMGDANNHMVGRPHNDHSSSSDYSDWVVVAIAIDRICFILYCLALIIMVASCFSD